MNPGNGGTSPRLVRIADGTTTPLKLPSEAEVHSVLWTADGKRLALLVTAYDDALFEYYTTHSKFPYY